ncbi:dihydrolipoamide acetyl transferase [Nitzschia inconspicua]|uniref:Dihydrolipoamide acetyltransferase component of pyruvate dehydrogenase complex n=1 Tax=Nitzschia inconspicua TaxID=303405 RepID=A0A9K3LEV8_9STRA|nr:dihydrolipoamide acetyl transferase [Nitzschia inconspicua]
MSSAAVSVRHQHRQMCSQIAVLTRNSTILNRNASSSRRGFWMASSSNKYNLSFPPTLIVSSQGSTTFHSPAALQHRSFHSTPMSTKEYPMHTLLPFPALSPTMESGTIAKWEIQEGDSFSAGSVLCSIETDKATMDFESQDDGILAKILKEGPNAVDLPIGSPIAVIVEDAEDVAAFADFVLEEGNADAPAAATSPTIGAASPEPKATSSLAPTTVGGESGSSILLPSARFLAESKGLDATGLTGSGKGGRVTKGDVLLAIQNGTPMPALKVSAKPEPAAVAAPPSPAPAPSVLSKISLTDLPLPEVETFGTFEDVANNNMRKVIARRLTESKREVPHYYTSMEVELDNVLKLRKQLAANHDVKVSVNDVIIRCVSLALRDVPECNGTYDPKTDSVKLQDSIDVSVAVATPGGLITPIVPHTDKLGLSEITEKVRDLAGRAREGKLSPQEYQGGTFCVSNLGMFGIDEFSAVINPPQAAIMAVGGGTRRIVATPYIDGAVEQPKPSVKTIMTARLSADRRVIDEATAALFMSAFKRYISKPELLLL